MCRRRPNQCHGILKYLISTLLLIWIIGCHRLATQKRNLELYAVLAVHNAKRWVRYYNIGNDTVVLPRVLHTDRTGRSVNPSFIGTYVVQGNGRARSPYTNVTDSINVVGDDNGVTHFVLYLSESHDGSHGHWTRHYAANQPDTGKPHDYENSICSDLVANVVGLNEDTAISQKNDSVVPENEDLEEAKPGRVTEEDIIKMKAALAMDTTLGINFVKCIETLQTSPYCTVSPQTIAYNSVLSAAERNANASLTLAVMDDMRKKENVIDGVSYKLAIVTCAKCGYTKDALDLYEEMIRNKHPVDHGVMRALMTPLAKEGKAIECLSVFNDMKGLDKIAQDGDTFLQIQDYIKAIEACSKAHMYDDALKMYKELRSSKIYKTNTDLITHVLELFNAMGNSNDALELYAEYLEEGNTMTPYQYKLLLTTLFMTRKYNQIESIYQNMRQNATDIDQNIYQIVLESYAKTGHYKNAMEIINAMELAKMLKDSYLPFIAAAEACEQTGEWKIALQLLRRANEHNKYKSIEMYNTVLAVCATAEEWDIMVSLYLEIENVCKQTREVTNGFALSGDTLAYAIMAYFYNDEVKQAENLLQKPIKDTPLLMKIRKNLQTPQTG